MAEGDTFSSVAQQATALYWCVAAASPVSASRRRVASAVVSQQSRPSTCRTCCPNWPCDWRRPPRRLRRVVAVAASVTIVNVACVMACCSEGKPKDAVALLESVTKATVRHCCAVVGRARRCGRAALADAHTRHAALIGYGVQSSDIKIMLNIAVARFVATGCLRPQAFVEELDRISAAVCVAASTCRATSLCCVGVCAWSSAVRAPCPPCAVVVSRWL